jgi:predicted ATPase
VTFLFTDIEGSTRLWQQNEDVMRIAVARHDALLHDAVAGHGGAVFSTMGDGLAAAFPSASSAVAAAQAAQDALAGEVWPTVSPIRVRMGLHTGEAELREGDYFGTAVNRTARLMAIGHGGQVLCSQATAALAGTNAALVDLGEHRLRDLDEPVHVFQVGGGEFGALRSLDAFPGNLPRRVTSFVGRDREVAAVMEALAEAPVVTLTGVGGVGKTRLALQAAADALPHYRDGAWLVELEALRDGGQVVDAVAGAFGLNLAADARRDDALVGFLRHKQLLLVIDNCEHVIGAAAAVICSVVASCMGVAVLATSREGLVVPGERIIAVPPLATPEPAAGLKVVAAAPAVRLFVDRAVAVDADFALSAANAAAVATVCRRLDGIPLAIELAATRAATMSAAELASRLDQRFRLLAGGRRGTVERHRTLWAAIDWSYELLTAAQQALLARLSVFAGGCTVDAVQAVCAGGPVEADEVFDLLSELVARSLVVADRAGPVTRYRLLETIRQYGEERLGPDAARELRARYAEHYARLAETCFANAWGFEEVERSRPLSPENENLAAALSFALDTDNADVGVRIAAWVYRLASSGFTMPIPAEPALALSGAADHPLYPRLLAKAAMEAVERGDRPVVEELCAQALDAERGRGNPSGGRLEARVCFAQACSEASCGLTEAAAAHFQRAGEIAFAAGDVVVAAARFANAAAVLVDIADDAVVVDAATKALALARQAGGSVAIVNALVALAGGLASTEPERARDLLTEAIASTDILGTAAQRTQVTMVAARLRDWPLTLRLARAAIPQLHWSQQNPGQYRAAALPSLFGMLEIAAGAMANARPDGAARLQGAAGSIGRRLAAKQAAGRRATGVGAAASTSFVTELVREATSHLAATLGEGVLSRRRREGEEMGLDDAVAYALAEIDAALGDPSVVEG